MKRGIITLAVLLTIISAQAQIFNEEEIENISVGLFTPIGGKIEVNQSGGLIGFGFMGGGFIVLLLILVLGAFIYTKRAYKPKTATEGALDMSRYYQYK